MTPEDKAWLNRDGWPKEPEIEDVETGITMRLIRSFDKVLTAKAYTVDEIRKAMVEAMRESSHDELMDYEYMADRVIAKLS